MARRSAPETAPAAHLRSATPNDLDGIVAIERVAFSDPWSPASFAGLLRGERVQITVADDGHGVVGYSVLMLAGPDADLANLAVSPKTRGFGIGRWLLEHSVRLARQAGVEHLYLEVRASNERAIALYASAGFAQFGVRERYYTDPVEDAHVLRLDVRGASAPREVSRE
jgi:ribosomal-protein-alanine N-acetyltransferase